MDSGALGSLGIPFHAVRGPNPGQPVSRDHVHDPQPDVHRVVRDSLQIPVHEDVPRPDLGVETSVFHAAHEVREDLVVHPVHRVVAFHDVPHALPPPPAARIDPAPPPPHPAAAPPPSPPPLRARARP